MRWTRWIGNCTSVVQTCLQGTPQRYLHKVWCCLLRRVAEPVDRQFWVLNSDSARTVSCRYSIVKCVHVLQTRRRSALRCTHWSGVRCAFREICSGKLWQYTKQNIGFPYENFVLSKITRCIWVSLEMHIVVFPRPSCPFRHWIYFCTENFVQCNVCLTFS